LAAQDSLGGRWRKEAAKLLAQVFGVNKNVLDLQNVDRLLAELVPNLGRLSQKRADFYKKCLTERHPVRLHTDRSSSRA
jgi:hypothetical protein